MKREDVFKVVMAIKAVYNTAFARYTQQDIEAYVNAWDMCLEDYDYNVVSVALKAYMTTNTSQFPPVPSQIIDIISKLKPQEQELNVNEAWALVYRAVCNSTYNAKAEFEKLPPTVQKAVGSAECLKAWATDADFNFGVEQSHFAKAYTIAQQREKEVAKLPNSIKTMIGLQTGERIGITG